MTVSTMRAVQQSRFGGPDVLEPVQVPRPAPGQTEVLVRVHAAGINPVDWKTRRGFGVAGHVGEPPFIPGWDVCGVVAETGAGVTTLRAGDEVYGMPRFPQAAGAYAEYVTAPADQLAVKPANLSHEQAAAVPLAALTAWQALVDTAKVRPGQRVLIHAAAGGVGHLAVQLARHLGAYVIGTASAGRHEWVTDLGADEMIDYRNVRFEDVVKDVDVVLDTVGDQDQRTGSRSLGVLRAGGHLVSIVAVTPEQARAAAEKGLRADAILVHPDGAALTAISCLLASGEVRVEVQEVFPLAEAGRAQAVGESGRTRGKLVLRVARF
jgi:NADPH:quinone reductase-like Zn-dependent oxidoreductase